MAHFIPTELTQVQELKILHNVRLISSHDLNPIYSKNNINVHFEISGDVKGAVNCYLCLDDCELPVTDKNFLYPLFVESMNILIGRQLSLDKIFNHSKLKISPPKLSLISKEINTSLRSLTQKYELELEQVAFDVLVEYNLTVLN